jgi:hypothetical protein
VDGREVDDLRTRLDEFFNGRADRFADYFRIADFRDDEHNVMVVIEESRQSTVTARTGCDPGTVTRTAPAARFAGGRSYPPSADRHGASLAGRRPYRKSLALK